MIRRPTSGRTLLGPIIAVLAGLAPLAAVAVLSPAARDTAKHIINAICDPRILLPLSVVVLGVWLGLRRVVIRPLVGISLALFAVGSLAAALLNSNFRLLATAPDNIAILIMLTVLAVFLWLTLREAVVADDLRSRGIPTQFEVEAKQRVLTWPDLVYVELLAAVFVMVALIAWSLLVKAPLEAPADPSVTPNPAKAPWYFVGLQEMLGYFDPWLAGVVFPGLIIVGLIALPYIDVNPKGSGYYCFRERRFAISTFMFGFLVLWIMPICFGTFLRGPGWSFFGPFEAWDRFRVDSQTAVNMSGLFWIRILGRSLPANCFVRELPGIVVLGLYFVGLPWLLRRGPLKRFRNTMGAARFAILIFLLLMMGLLPLKMFLHWTIDVKYIVAFPEWAFNI